MERSIFSWDSWDTIDTLALQFNNCTFIKDFGPFKSNQNVPIIMINFEDGKISVWLDASSPDPAFTGTLRFELI